jgi:hypothetical protein
MEKGEIDYSKQGKKNRNSGRIFEAQVREDLENMGWIVNKWTNTVDSDSDGKKGKLVKCKPKFNPFTKSLMMNTGGFPDFVCFKRNSDGNYEVIGLEVKSTGYLDQKEKGMCIWLLENKIFSRILIAKKNKKEKTLEIEYLNFREKYKKDEKFD